MAASGRRTVPAPLGLPSDLVFAVAVGGDGRIWAGTDRGVGVLDPRTQTWQRYDQPTPGWSGTPYRRLPSRLMGASGWARWAAASPSSTGRRGQTQTTANSGLPWNTIMALAAGPAGDVWVAADLPARPAAMWRAWTAQRGRPSPRQRSGIAAGGRLLLRFRQQGRVYIGMRDSGISIYTTGVRAQDVEPAGFNTWRLSDNGRYDG